MKAGMRRWQLRTGRWVGALALATASLAEAQQGSIGGVVTDEATGQPLEAARVILVGPNRIEATNQEGRYRFRNVAPGSYQVRVLRLGYRPATDSANVAPGETVTLDFALTARAGPARRDRHHRHRRAAEAGGGQRGRHHRRGPGGRGVADRRVRQSALRPGGRRAGPEERRHHRHRHPDPDPRVQQRLALQRAAVLHRRHPDGERRHARARLDIGGFGQGAGAGPSRINDLNPDDIESIEIVKGPAAATLYGIQASNGVVRDHHQAGRAPARPRWNLYTELGAVTRPQHLSRSTSTAGTTPGDRSRLGRLLHPAVRAGRALHPDLGEPVLSRWTTRPPARSRPGSASSTASTSPAATSC